MRALPEWHFRLEHLNDVVHSARGVDVSAWHLVDVPHDFAIEDLPPSRGPEVLAMRNSSGWRFKAGDNPRWSLPEHGDRRWRQVPVPADCRTYGTTLSSGFMWFRHRFVASTEQIRLDAAGKLRLALGAIADADETFVNGVRIGKTGLFPQDEPRLQPWEPIIRPRFRGCLLRRAAVPHLPAACRLPARQRRSAGCARLRRSGRRVGPTLWFGRSTGR